MKTIRSTGLFSERPYFREDEIERTATEELRGTGLLPGAPAPVRIERFVEKRFGISVQYDELPDGVLGFTQFSKNGVKAIVVSSALCDERSRVAERRINSTIAHEAGHALLHAYLFLVDSFPHSLFDDERDVTPTKILCRDAPRTAGSSGYDGRWWEYQANQIMGALLLPRTLVVECVKPHTVQEGVLGVTRLPDASRRQATLLVAETFEVNGRLAELRLEKVYQVRDKDQLTL